MWEKKSKTKEPDNESKGYDYAVFLLSLKLRTEGEIFSKMKERGYLQGVVSQVIERLKSKRYLDDERYAEIYLDNLKRFKNFGYYGIKKKLLEKRLPPKLVETALSENLSEEEELKIAKKFLLKEPNLPKEKMFQRLKSRGFRPSVILKAVEVNEN